MARFPAVRWSESTASTWLSGSAPTNGAAGIVPAVAHYYQRFTASPSEAGIERYFLSAGAIGIPGLYVTGDPGGIDENAKVGRLSIRIGLGWARSHSFTTGQCPVMKYNRQLMQAILFGKINIAKAVNVEVIRLDDAPRGYKDFDKGAAKKFVLDPHGAISRN